MRYIIFLAILLTGSLCVAQGKKEVKKYNIREVTETLTYYEDGVAQTRPESYEKFDKDGNTVEKIDYNKEGKIKERVVRKYDRFGEQTEEIVFDGDGKQKEREVYKYNNMGEKSEEWKYDENDQLISKSYYTLDGRGLKTEKKTYDAAGNPIEVKNYEYKN